MNRDRRPINVHFQLPSDVNRSFHTMPIDALSMDCYLLNVTGPGITSSLAPSDLGGVVTPACLGLGSVSSVVSLSALQSTGLDITVPTGASRTFSLLGISNTGIAGCGTTSLGDIFQLTTEPSMYSLGRETTDIFQDTTLTINDSYTSTTADQIKKCEPTTSGPSASSAVIALTAAYIGDTLMPAQFSNAERILSLPTTSTASQTLMGPFILSNLINSTGYSDLGIGSGSAARLDLVFDANSVGDSTVIAQYSAFRISFTLSAGTSSANSGICTPFSGASGTGATGRFYIAQGSVGWTNFSVSTTNGNQQKVEGVFNEVPPSDLILVPSHKTPSQIVFSIRGNDTVTSNQCSNIVVSNVLADLE